MESIITKLRAELNKEQPSQPLEPRPLPEVKPEYGPIIQRTAARVNALPQLPRLGMIITLIHENSRLTTEVNELRGLLGIAPIPTYTPGVKNG